MIYPTQKTTFSDMYRRAIRSHLLTLKNIFLYAVLFVLFNALYQQSFSWWQVGTYQNVALNLVYVFLIVFTFTAAVFVTDKVFKGDDVSLVSGFVGVVRRLPKIYLVLLLYVLGAYIVRYFAQFLLIAIGKLIEDPSGVHGATFFVAVAMVFTFLAMFCFAIPLSAIEDKPVARVFYDSMYISDKHKYGIFVLAFTLFWTAMLLMPGKFFHRIEFIQQFHLGALVNLLILCVIAPFVVNLTVLLLNDGRLQLALEDL